MLPDAVEMSSDSAVRASAATVADAVRISISSRDSASGTVSVSSLRQELNARCFAPEAANWTCSVLPSSHQCTRSSSGMPSSAASDSRTVSCAWVRRFTLPLAQSISIFSIFPLNSASPAV